MPIRKAHTVHGESVLNSPPRTGIRLYLFVVSSKTVWMFAVVATTLSRIACVIRRLSLKVCCNFVCSLNVLTC
ncbi:hypothetical protein BDV59DRAFT_172184 [Aspergillus ambiguus]|uniref:uncharacterized protein n=1 Tax=Aspergillus ambiguus TaxID=176160 RepID=UPI003CCD4957